MQQRRLSVAIQMFLQQRNLTQIDLARVAKVSQSTVSRAARMEPTRWSRAHQRLFTYMQKAGIIAPPFAGEQLVLAAFEDVWDRSVEHASAVARIIKATEDLRPVRKESA